MQRVSKIGLMSFTKLTPVDVLLAVEASVAVGASVAEVAVSVAVGASVGWETASVGETGSVAGRGVSPPPQAERAMVNVNMVMSKICFFILSSVMLTLLIRQNLLCYADNWMKKLCGFLHFNISVLFFAKYGKSVQGKV